MRKQVVLSLSGGMDSSALLVHYLRNDYSVTAISFDYGQKHIVELDRAKSLIEYLKTQDLDVQHAVIKLDGLSAFLHSSLVTGGTEVPEGHYEQENMKDTVVPNRNKIFSSIIQSIALSIAQRTGTNVEIALGIHAGDHDIYPDCREEFRAADFAAFLAGNWGGERVRMVAPYLHLNKFDILQLAVQDCLDLSIYFNEVFRRTNTSYKPLKNDGVWYSDYKSASSVERIEAFIKLGRPDPVAYADERGPAPWAVAQAHVVEVLATHNS